MIGYRFQHFSNGNEFADNPGANSHVIIAGFGRFGQIVARVLTAKRIPFTALDKDPNQVEVLRRFGTVVYFGDPTRLELLRAAGPSPIMMSI